MRVHGLELQGDELTAAAEHGPQLVANAGARLLGLGGGEQQALAAGGMPTWAWVGLGLLVGAAAGSWAGLRYPKTVGRIFR
jgi:hypothetical protein